VPRQVGRKQGTRCPLAFREQVQRSERASVLANGDTVRACRSAAGVEAGGEGGGGRPDVDGVVVAELTFR
jgi:hypothetical protein